MEYVRTGRVMNNQVYLGIISYEGNSMTWINRRTAKIADTYTHSYKLLSEERCEKIGMNKIEIEMNGQYSPCGIPQVYYLSAFTSEKSL